MSRINGFVSVVPYRIGISHQFLVSSSCNTLIAIARIIISREKNSISHGIGCAHVSAHLALLVRQSQYALIRKVVLMALGLSVKRYQPLDSVCGSFPLPRINCRTHECRQLRVTPKQELFSDGDLPCARTSLRRA